MYIHTMSLVSRGPKERVSVNGHPSPGWVTVGWLAPPVGKDSVPDLIRPDHIYPHWFPVDSDGESSRHSTGIQATYGNAQYVKDGAMIYGLVWAPFKIAVVPSIPSGCRFEEPPSLENINFLEDTGGPKLVLNDLNSRRHQS